MLAGVSKTLLDSVLTWEVRSLASSAECDDELEDELDEELERERDKHWLCGKAMSGPGELVLLLGEADLEEEEAVSSLAVAWW